MSTQKKPKKEKGKGDADVGCLRFRFLRNLFKHQETTHKGHKCPPNRVCPAKQFVPNDAVSPQSMSLDAKRLLRLQRVNPELAQRFHEMLLSDPQAALRLLALFDFYASSPVSTPNRVNSPFTVEEQSPVVITPHSVAPESTEVPYSGRQQFLPMSRVTMSPPPEDYYRDQVMEQEYEEEKLDLTLCQGTLPPQNSPEKSTSNSVRDPTELHRLKCTCQGLCSPNLVLAPYGRELCKLENHCRRHVTSPDREEQGQLFHVIPASEGPVRCNSACIPPRRLKDVRRAHHLPPPLSYEALGRPLPPESPSTSPAAASPCQSNGSIQPEEVLAPIFPGSLSIPELKEPVCQRRLVEQISERHKRCVGLLEPTECTLHHSSAKWEDALDTNGCQKPEYRDALPSHSVMNPTSFYFKYKTTN